MSWAVWRHPKPRDAVGRCIGRTDLGVDPRKAKRLAHRVRAWARQHHAPRVVTTSTLQRAADVGRWLARWGWTHRVDERLDELDFGTWDGRPWSEIGAAAVDAWCADFAAHAPGGGEAVAMLLLRCASFLQEPPGCVVAHAGWISAACWRLEHEGEPSAAKWPAAVGYGELKAWSDPAASASSRAGSGCSSPTARRGRYRPTSR